MEASPLCTEQKQEKPWVDVDAAIIAQDRAHTHGICSLAYNVEYRTGGQSSALKSCTHFSWVRIRHAVLLR